MSSWGTLIGVSVAAAYLAVTLAGCAAPAQPEASVPEPTSTPSPTVTASAALTATPTATPDAITCETAFTADINRQIAKDGLTFREDDIGIDADTVVGTDGLRCRWTKSQTDITVTYANWPRDTAAWETLKTELLADGYSETGQSAVSRPVPEFDSAYSFRNGVIYYVSPSRFLESATARQ